MIILSESVFVNVFLIEELNSKEQFYISEYNTTDKTLGYNLKLGGNNGGKCCDTTKTKISLSSKQKVN